jgi:hypothetical protein
MAQGYETGQATKESEISAAEHCLENNLKELKERFTALLKRIEPVLGPNIPKPVNDILQKEKKLSSPTVEFLRLQTFTVCSMIDEIKVTLDRLEL